MVYQQDNGQTVVIPYNGTSYEKEWTTDKSNHTGDSQKHYAEQKKPTTKVYVLDDSISMNFQRRRKESMVTDNRSAVARGHSGGRG